ncbi:MAG TPA: glycosyltransferase [Candidatus Acidoferrales bacterium]|nr:glycosyltransferase [Candidatus Acidoferrales bacterium]
MKIIYLTASMPYGSGETFLIEEVRELLSRGHQVFVVPRSPSRRLAHSSIPAACLVREGLYSYGVVRDALRVSAAAPRSIAAGTRPLLRVRSAALRLKNLAVIPKALWVARLATRLKADHIHCHWAGTTASMAMVAAALSGISWSLTAHRWDIVENNALDAKVRSASFVRVISDDGLRLMGTLGIEPARIRVLRMGVRIPRRHEWETAGWTPPASPVVLCPANLVEIKGHRFLIEAWRILRDRGFDGELWIAGDGELKPSLERLAARMHPDGGVKFLGRVSHERLLGFYRSGVVSAVVLASLDLGKGSHEGIPVALMEAMGYGVPVVAADSGGVPELVNSNTGILTPPGDSAALAAGLERALTGGPSSQHLASRGRRYVEEHHDVVSIAATLEQWFLAASARGTNSPAAVGALQAR